MKRVVYMIMIALVAIGLSGCGSVSKSGIKVPDKINNNFNVHKKDGNIYQFWSRMKCYKYSNLGGKEGYKKGAINLFNLGIENAKFYGKTNGYSYMAIVNSGTNNLVGFPLNTKKDFDKYIGLKNYKHFNPMVFSEKKDTLFKRGSLNLKVIYFKKKIPGIFLFKL